MKKTRMQKENALRRVLRYFRLLPTAFCLLLVRLYQLILSPAKNALMGPAGHCRFEPSCSQYAVEALKIHGAVGGSWLAAKRICRCHPWGAYGEDPVPPIKVGRVTPCAPPQLQQKRRARSDAPYLHSQSTVPSADMQVSNVGIH